MLRKCLKHDLKSVIRIWWIVAISILALSVVGSAILRLTLELILNQRGDLLGSSALAEFSESLLLIAGIALSFLCMAAIATSGLVTAFLVYYRFYKNFFTDEGYLTFTLPVSRKTLLTSKVLNALIFQSAHGLLLVICIAIYLFVAPPAAEGYLFNPGAFRLIGTGLRVLWEGIGAWLLFYMVEGVLLLAVSTLFTVGLIHFCITVGAVLAKKLKLLAAIGVYYLVNMVLSFGGQMLYFVLLTTAGEGLAMLFDRLTGIGQGCAAVALLLGIATAILFALSCILHFITLGSIERKLNLA